MTKIITCIDGSAITSSVARAGVWAALKLNRPLTLLHTLEKHYQHGADDLTGAIGLGAQAVLLEQLTELDEQKARLALQLGDELLQRVATEARNDGVEAVETLQRHGDLIEAVMNLETDTRLIVLGRCSHQRDNFQAIGSHIETLLRKACHPVLIVPAHFQPPTSFMIAYDGRESADRALQKVLEGGLLHGIDCHLVSVKNNEPELENKFRQAASALTEKGLNVTSAWLEGDIHNALSEYQQAHHIELMVMGAFGHSRLRQFFVGSNTLKMIEKSPVPLIILR